MIQETAVAIVRRYLSWNEARIETLSEGAVRLKNPAAYRRNGEFWIRSDVWIEVVWEFDDNQAEEGARHLDEARLLHRQSEGGTFQSTKRIHGEHRRVYAIAERILSWKPPRKSPNGPANGSALPAIAPPVMPANFNSLPPGERQDYLLAASMYLQSQLLSIAQRLAPESAKEIAQLASVAQGIVKTSIELDQLRVTGTNVDALRELAAEIRAWPAADRADGKRA